MKSSRHVSRVMPWNHGEANKVEEVAWVWLGSGLVTSLALCSDSNGPQDHLIKQRDLQVGVSAIRFSSYRHLLPSSTAKLTASVSRRQEPLALRAASRIDQCRPASDQPDIHQPRDIDGRHHKAIRNNIQAPSSFTLSITALLSLGNTQSTSQPCLKPL